jgi:hypothetical protein
MRYGKGYDRGFWEWDMEGKWEGDTVIARFVGKVRKA